MIFELPGRAAFLKVGDGGGTRMPFVEVASIGLTIINNYGFCTRTP